MKLVLHPVVYLAASMTLVVPAAAMQEVSGRLLDGVTREPIILGRVALLDSALAAVDATWTDEEGHFILHAPAPGNYYLAAEREGYHAKLDGILELPRGASMEIAFYLRPSAIPLKPLSVEARRQLARDYLGQVGFTERLEMGQGWFITPEELEKTRVSEVTHLFRSTPGASIQELGAISTVVFASRGNPSSLSGGGDPEGTCTPRVLVDGTEVTVKFREGITTGADLGQAAHVHDILAVEVHRSPATLPLIYGGVTNNCATILIWTIHGPRTVTRGAPSRF